MKIEAFYSPLRGIAVEDIWHDNDECEIGLSIARADRLPGKGGLVRPYRHCQYCHLLNQPWHPPRWSPRATLPPAAMLLHSLHFPTGGQCLLSYETTEGWLSATWTGYIGTAEAMQGATNYLAHVGPFHCLYLLNDNLGLRGPWFDSVEWLEHAWLVQAERLGLRYVAHVVQSDAHADILTLGRLDLLKCELEIQLFYDRAAAESWLRSCQQPPVGHAPGPPRL